MISSQSDGDALPESFPTVTSCTVLRPARNPATGEILLQHSVCIRSEDEGLFLYPAEGGSAPKKLVAYSYEAGAVAPDIATASWVGDGSGFVFVARATVDRGEGSEVVVGLFFYDMTKGTFAPLVIPPSGTTVRGGAVAPDATSIVYCLRRRCWKREPPRHRPRSANADRHSDHDRRQELRTPLLK